MSAETRPFRRSRDHRLIAGVCAGVAGHWGWDRRVVRLLWLIGTVIPVLPGMPLYLILWLLVRAD